MCCSFPLGAASDRIKQAAAPLWPLRAITPTSENAQNSSSH